MFKPLSETEFEKLVFENQSLIIKVCNIYCRYQTDRDDLFQDIVLNLWKGRHSYKGHAKWSTWMYRVSINTAISKIKRGKRSRLFFPKKLPETAATEPEGTAGNDQQIKALYAAIKQLKPIEKAIILLHLEEKKYHEISEIIGISKKNVSVKLVRIKRKLKKIMESILAKKK